MQVVDLSHTLDSNVQVYPGDPISFSCCPTLTIAEHGCNVSSISMGSHIGTHVDAPYHFFEHGAAIDKVSLNTFVGPAVVVDLTAKGPRDMISWADIASHEDELLRRGPEVILLLRMGWSKFWQTKQYMDHPFLARDAAQKVINLGVKAIGVDTFSPDETRVDETTPDFGVHQIVLGAGAVIAENLTNLEAIQEGEWVVSLVPLKLSGGDGSPIRACAWKQT
ncbi:Kynurenine formamidase [Grifola frondosa]|uniref:Kynurenine formamidase n=1 Tax=Grifola frondosa TaxID=5627 RepID=A0A1C7LZR4_GRIFR|nr:Kynurenine formamidase [Grifola frondosa]